MSEDATWPHPSRQPNYLAVRTGETGGRWDPGRREGRAIGGEEGRAVVMGWSAVKEREVGRRAAD